MQGEIPQFADVCTSNLEISILCSSFTSTVGLKIHSQYSMLPQPRPSGRILRSTASFASRYSITDQSGHQLSTAYHPLDTSGSCKLKMTLPGFQTSLSIQRAEYFQSIHDILIISGVIFASDIPFLTANSGNCKQYWNSSHPCPPIQHKCMIKPT